MVRLTFTAFTVGASTESESIIILVCSNTYVSRLVASFAMAGRRDFGMGCVAFVAVLACMLPAVVLSGRRGGFLTVGYMKPFEML